MNEILSPLDNNFVLKILLSVNKGGPNVVRPEFRYENGRIDSLRGVQCEETIRWDAIHLVGAQFFDGTWLF